jgi:hypothetical protein
MTDAQRKNPKFGYRAPRELAQGIWELSGEWNNKLGRRMTVIRLKRGAIFVHNAFHLKKQDLNWLASLGEVKYIVAPNTFHCSDAGWMKHQFPQAQLFVPKSQLGLEGLDTESDFPEELASELLYLPSRGTKIEEAVFLHVPSRTLILTDLAFNMGDVFSGLEKFAMNLNFVGQGLGPSRVLKWVFGKDREELKRFYGEMLRLDFDRVIVNHGDIVDRDGRRLLKSGAIRLFGSMD